MDALALNVVAFVSANKLALVFVNLDLIGDVSNPLGSTCFAIIGLKSSSLMLEVRCSL